MTPERGRFGVEVMEAVLATVAERLRVSTVDARRLRLTNNAVYLLPRAGIVVRIQRSHGLAHRVHKVVALARWFERRGAPTVRLLGGVDQPVPVGPVLATVWHHVPPTPPEPTVPDLGPVLHTFHRLGPPDFPLPRWDPVGDVRARLADAEGLAAPDRAYLTEWCDRLAPRLAALDAGDLIHGDAHAGNLLRGPDGAVVLCDFDSTGRGPRVADLVPVLVGEARFGRVGQGAALAAAYGYDVRADPAWPLLREARELKLVTAALPWLGSAPRVRAEFATRLKSIVDGDDGPLWTPYADLV